MDEITAMIQSNFNKVFEKINELNKRIDKIDGLQKITQKPVQVVKEPRVEAPKEEAK